MNKLSKTNTYVWLGLIILLALIVRTYHINCPIIDIHSFRQTQTAGLIRDFYRHGINLLYPTMISLGDPGYVILEFPLYQAISALLYKMFFPDVIFARLVSIVCALLSIVFVYRLSIKFLDQKSAIFASLFFAFTPLNIFYNRVPMPDSMTMLLSLVMLDFLIEGINNKKNYFLISGIVAGSLGLMLKSPYVAPLYLPIIYMTYKQARSVKALLNIRLFISLLIPLTFMVFWQQHANSINELYFNTNDYPFKELYSSVVVKLHPFNTWYFGNIAQRLDLNNYLIILKRIFKEILSIIGIIFLISGFLAVIKIRLSVFLYIWFLSIICSIMLIFNLNITHSFYQLPLVPILSIFCGAGAVYFIELANNKKLQVITTLLISFYLFMSLAITERLFKKTNDLVEVGQFIDRSIEKSAMIATSLPSDDVWAPMLMYYSDRHGFNVPHKRLNEEMVGYLRNKSIKYLTLVDYNGGDDLINTAIAPYRILTKNDRLKIYDISVR